MNFKQSRKATTIYFEDLGSKTGTPKIHKNSETTTRPSQPPKVFRLTIGPCYSRGAQKTSTQNQKLKAATSSA